jgi:hypothetical protein
MLKTSSLADLKPNPQNPRKITTEKAQALVKALRKFGDLSGIVLNTRTGLLVTGHQRSAALKDRLNACLVVTSRHAKPTKTGTVAEGYVENDGEKFSYREVVWDDRTAKAAALAANQNAGTWDLPQVALWMQDLQTAAFDLDVTMFGPGEIEMLRYELPQQTVGPTLSDRPLSQESSHAEGEERLPGASMSPADSGSGSAVEFGADDFADLKHTCPRCGFGFTPKDSP